MKVLMKIEKLYFIFMKTNDWKFHYDKTLGLIKNNC